MISTVSEPGRGRTSSESIARTQIRAIPSEPRPTNARWRPSGDRPKLPGPAKFDARRNLEAHRVRRRRAAREHVGTRRAQASPAAAQPRPNRATRCGVHEGASTRPVPDALDASDTPLRANARSLAV